MSNTITKETLEQKLDEANSEMDSAVKAESPEQAKYWLGRKDALRELLREVRDADN